MKQKPLEVTLNLPIQTYDNEEIVTSAIQTGFFINLETMRPMAIPEEIQQIYAQCN